MPLEVFAISNTNTFVFDPQGSDRPRFRTARADAYGVVAESLAKVTDQGALDRELTAADKERLLAFLKTMGDLGDDLGYRGDPRRRGFAVVWGLEPFVEGGWQPADARDSDVVDSPRFRPLAEPTGRVFRAGDWLGNMLGRQHGSMFSVRKAVEKVHTRALMP